MAWYGLIDATTGELLSIGTEAMFDSGDVSKVPPGHQRRDFGASKPDLATQMWDAATRTWIARPAPVVIDRITDIQNLLLANSNFSTTYNTLTTARKNALIAGLRAVLSDVLGPHANRAQNESVNL
jgi:hypothetical protein